MTAPPIHSERLTKRFGDVTAVDGLDLTLEPGTVLGFLGPNGAGKSTTIRMLLGLSTPTTGTVRIFGADPRREHRVRARIGYSPGELRLDDRLTVAATLDSWSRLRGNVDASFRAELIERLGVDPTRHVRDLSTGNRRKVALIGAFMARPDLLVLDEPSNGLDPLVQNELMSVLAEAADAGATVLLSSHVLSEVERVAEQVLVIRRGLAVAAGPIAELRRGAAQEIRATYSGPTPDLTRIRALPGTRDAQEPASGELRVSWAGPPTPLLAELATGALTSLTAPEPDLETAFLSYYRTEGSTL